MKTILPLILVLSLAVACAPKVQPRYQADSVPNALADTTVEQPAQVDQAPAPIQQSGGSCGWCWVFAPVKLIIGVAAWTVFPEAGATLINIAINDVLDE